MYCITQNEFIMPYSDFKSLRQLEKQFGITYTFDHIFTDIQPVMPSHYLTHDLLEAQDYPTYPSEKAKSELMIMPVIKEIKRNNPSFQVFSGFSFDVDSSQGLNGFCDYLFSKEPKILEIKSPVFVLLKPKIEPLKKVLHRQLLKCMRQFYLMSQKVVLRQLFLAVSQIPTFGFFFVSTKRN